MNPLITIWIDLTGKPSQSEYYQKLSGRCDIHYLKEAMLIPDCIRNLSPGLLCFEFDAPDPDQLQTLRQTKEKYPSLPVLLVTEYHSEELAVLSLRMRVWDYLVKPVSPEQILEHIRAISCLSKNVSRRKMKTENVPISPIPIEVRCSGLETEGKKECPTYQAVSYIEKYYGEKIREKIREMDVARICGLQTIRFSLLFKKEQGITFQKYLMQYRIHKAADLLKNPSEKVTHAASSVGFNDLSDFARIFKEYMGITPLKYRQQQKG